MLNLSLLESSTTITANSLLLKREFRQRSRRGFKHETMFNVAQSLQKYYRFPQVICQTRREKSPGTSNVRPLFTTKT